MRYSNPIRAFALLAGLAAPLCGQIMHLHLESTAGFHGEYVSTPYHNEGDPLWVDVYYNPALSPVDNPFDSGAYYTPLDANNNFFHVRTTGVDVRGRLDSIWMSDYGVWFRSTDSPHAYDAFNLLLAWITPPAGYALPAGTFPQVDPHTFQEGADPLFFGGPDVFGNAGPDGQYNWGSLYRRGFLTLENEVVPRMSMSPVPEPSTYAAGGVALLLMAVALRRKRAKRAIAAA